MWMDIPSHHVCQSNILALLVQIFCAHLQASLGGVLHLYTICIEEKRPSLRKHLHFRCLILNKSFSCL